MLLGIDCTYQTQKITLHKMKMLRILTNHYAKICVHLSISSSLDPEIFIFVYFLIIFNVTFIYMNVLGDKTNFILKSIQLIISFKKRHLGKKSLRNVCDLNVTLSLKWME